ncbi:MAG: bifunctional sulfate adenylyltransferase/adenylylsulfate kinase [Chloroflexi bacterium]|nr:bifunctional sulfate adenylyltransferase/adenylylsulfate kinase [Chloroflexota bacterium]MYA94577.1 bifunctional sulfate adenylyltransferase/adenylylsulfate kinase [Chloroflexota bacterium]MYC56624.1 bifunctional sulfate adenylyltransferase/adenylylsulfate kinase [Chloroflexota bacterium]MYD39155.1 bifunctional sulfate adenylyltransferase/adenylylsulfate kinase [Chloroflexota bacterium]MYE79816.1 bifunctional sulfate adenylyltransferase/adenylylsulfate kinase [Chloroflexota bacterium]
MPPENPMPKLISPYGGELVDLLVPREQLLQKTAYANTLPSIQVSPRVVCDLELLAVGAFSPLRGFMNEADFRSVLETMRLADGRLFPMPITLPVEPNPEWQPGKAIALRDSRNNLLAIQHIEEVYAWDLEATAAKIFGKYDTRHPIIAEMHRWGSCNISGCLEVLQMPPHLDFAELRRSPAQTRAELESYGYPNVVAFQTRNPLHRVHEALTKRAAATVDGVLLLHPVVGMTQPGDVDHYTRVRVYKTLIDTYYQADRSLLSLLPLAMRMGGPREAVWHAIIRRNYGANYFIVGRDHAGPGKDSSGKPFYGPYDAQDLLARHSQEIGVEALPFAEMVYLEDEDRYEERAKLPEGARTRIISGTQVREEYLEAGIPLPAWFSRPEVADILAQSYPPRHRRGLCLWFTGLSGSGKSTTAERILNLLLEAGRNVTLLDGDVVRTHLSKGLGFSKADRDTNIRRIGYVASEIVRHGGLVICAAISPYRATRQDVRNLVGAGFMEIHMATPLEFVEAHDIKGLYAKARRGEIKGFTGIDDPYEPPLNPEFTLTAVGTTAADNARLVIDRLIELGYILPR